MGDSCSILLGFIVAILVIALVGHGVWIGLAALFRAITGRSKQPRIDYPIIDDDSITSKRLQQLHREGKIDQATFQAVLRALNAKTVQPPIIPLAQRAVQPPAPPTAAPPIFAQVELLEQNPFAKTSTPTAPPPPPPIPPLEVQPFRPPPPPRQVIPFTPPSPPPPPRPPRKPFSEIFKRFMEESNIRWGELIGGLLIIGCSIALVLTFWEQIANQPWLRFFLFTAVTSALFGTGLYTEHRWKLPTTSRGILLIATLLVPLNFLAFSRGGATSSAISQEAIAFALFAWFIWTAGKVLAGRWAIPLLIGILGPCIIQSLMAGVAAPSAGTTLLLALLAVVFYLASNTWTLASTQKQPDLDSTTAYHSLLILGASTFSVLLPLIALAVKTHDWFGTTRHLAPALTLLAAPMLAVGLLLWRRLKSPHSAGLQTTAIAIAIFGAFVLLASIAFSWPDPPRMIATALLAFATLTAIAFLFDIPQAHLLALPCLGLVYILAFHLLQPATHPDHLSWSAQNNLPRAILSASTGSSLLALVFVLGIASEWLSRKNRPATRYYALATIAFAAFSLALITLFGAFNNPDHGATWIYLGYAILATWLAGRIDRSEATWVAIALLACAAVQGVVFRYPLGHTHADRFTLAALLHATILTLAMLLTWRLAKEREHTFTHPFSNGALFSSIIASALIVSALIFTQPLPNLTILSLRAAWIAAILLAIAILYISPSIFSAFQTALAAALVLATIGQLQHQPWFTSAEHPLIHARTLQTAAIALALLSLVWTIFRLIFRRAADRFWTLLNPPWPSVDSMIAYIALAVFVVNAIIAIVPGIADELANKNAKPLGQISFPLITAGPRAWLLFAATTLALFASLWIRFRRTVIISIFLALAGACCLAAASFDPQASSASAFRWLLSILLLLGSAILWLRQPIAQLAQRAHWPDFENHSQDLSAVFRPTLLALTVLPILAITLYSAAMAIIGTTIVGPAPNSFFARIGNSISYLLPLALIIAIFIGHAFRERSSSFAFAAALLLNLTVTLGYMLYLVTNHHPIAAIQWIHLIQFNAIAAAAFSLAWIFFARRDETPSLLIFQSALAPIALLSLLLIFLFQLIIEPTSLTLNAREVCGLYGSIAWLLSGAAAIYLFKKQSRALSPALLCILLLIASSLASLRLINQTWLPYHALLSFTALSAWLMLAFGAFSVWRKPDLSPSREQITSFTLLLASITLLLSLRALFNDPTRPNWTVYGLLAVSPLAIGLSFWTMRSLWLYPAALLVNIALTLSWIFGHHPPIPSPLLGLIQLNILALSLAGAALLALELFILRPLRSQVIHVGFAAFHHFAAIASLVAIIFVALASLAADIFSLTATSNPILTWSAPAATLLLLIATLYDRDARYTLFSLYLLAFVIAATALHEFHLKLDDLVWLWIVITAGISVLLAYAYMFRSPLAIFAESISIAPREDWPSQNPGWVGLITFIQSILVFVIAFFAVQLLANQLPRLAVAAGAISMAVALGLLAHASNQQRLRSATLTLGLFSAILWGWALLPRTGSDLFLNRTVIVTLAMAAMSVFYAIGLVKILRRENDWTAAARKLVPLLGIGTALSVLLVFVSEGMTYRPHLGAPMAAWAFASFALALIVMAIAAMICAIVPGRDPLNLSDRLRQAYVYATELLLVLLFVHVALVHPDLLNLGIWSRFWPIIVMILAFAGIGLSELFRRQNRPVLAEPLENTSLLLPFLPIISFWLLTGVWKHQEHVNYALVLLLAGAAWGTLAALRRSFIFGLLSALAGNGALWYLLFHSPTLGFLQHPQLWLIPVSLSILAAAYLNRARLSASHMRNLRYLCLMTIYASSTADIMINGINQSPALPMLLALLSVAGVLCGILMRIQSFLFLGTLFLLVSLAAMIQYAAHRVGQNWPWLVAGILLGGGIIILFALFEKKRTEMLTLVDGLKEWQA